MIGIIGTEAMAAPYTCQAYVGTVDRHRHAASAELPSNRNEALRVIARLRNAAVASARSSHGSARVVVVCR